MDYSTTDKKGLDCWIAMKHNTVIIIMLAVLCVGLGGTTIVTVSQNWELNEQLEDLKAVSSKSVADSSEKQRLRQLLDEREVAYAQLQDNYQQLKLEMNGAENTSPASSRVVATNLAVSVQVGTNAPVSYLDRLRESDPERYRQITTEIEQRRQERDQWYANQISDLNRRTQTAQTPEEAEVARQLAETLAKMSELRAQEQNLRNLKGSEQRAAVEQLMRESREAYDALNKLGPMDRQIQLQNLARSIGYTDPAAIQAFVNGIRTIYKNTEYSDASRSDRAHSRARL